MESESGVAAIGHVIQLSVAPVFLLSAIAGILAVVTNRLSRIVDRARHKEARLAEVPEGQAIVLHAELRTLSRRAGLCYRSLLFCTLTAILVCAVVIALFVGTFLGVDSSLAVAILFVLGMVSFVVGLLLLLREVFLATASLRIGRQG